MINNLLIICTQLFITGRRQPKGRLQGSRSLLGREVRLRRDRGKEDLVLRPRRNGTQHPRRLYKGSAVLERNQGFRGGWIPVGRQGGRPVRGELERRTLQHLRRNVTRRRYPQRWRPNYSNDETLSLRLPLDRKPKTHGARLSLRNSGNFLNNS